MPELDGGPGPALPISDGKMRSMIDAAITGGSGPGGEHGSGGAEGSEVGASGSGSSVAVKLGLAGLGLGAVAVVIAVVVTSGVLEREQKARPASAPAAEPPEPPPPRSPTVTPLETEEPDEPAPTTTTPRAEPEPPPQATSPPRTKSPEPVMTPPAMTPDDLLRRANQARKQRAWREADALYRKVWSIHPDSRAAYVAMVASAQLNLGKLGEPAAALRLFRRALRQDRRGFLTEEARFGLARALRQLGRSDAEKAALERFVREHADSALAPRARERLEALRGGASP